MDKKSSQINKAKQLFMDYLGNPFLMHHDGVRELYLSYNISKTQEKVWYEELKTNLMRRLSEGEYSAIGGLRNMSAFEVFPKILTITPEGDNWTKLRFAEELWGFMEEVKESHSFNRRIINQARNKATEIWEDLLQDTAKPCVPDDVMTVASNGLNENEYFNRRVELNLKKSSAF